MNKTTIKEIKSIYSGKLRSGNAKAMQPEIKAIKSMKQNDNNPQNKFFTGVIEKLNIIVQKDDKTD